MLSIVESWLVGQGVGVGVSRIVATAVGVLAVVVFCDDR